MLHLLDQHDWEYEVLCDQFRTNWLKFQPRSGVSIVRIFSLQVWQTGPTARWGEDCRRLAIISKLNVTIMASQMSTIIENHYAWKYVTPFEVRLFLRSTLGLCASRSWD